MKSKQHQSYSIKIIEEPFDNGLFFLPNTAVIIFRDTFRNVVKKEKYGVLDPQDVYDKIKAGELINISNCYLKNFSLFDYKDKFGIDKGGKVEFSNFCAIRTFF
ncbi:MAG: hypothetical protein JKY54_00855, partial [Flavobacteriales bacterium]|nr:hypothetical protein [Flavobacteriales bacterium]